MKHILIAIVVTLVTLTHAVHLQQDPTDDEHLLFQCTCDEQFRGMEEIKNLFTVCSKQCRETEADKLKLLIDSPVKLYSCIDQKVDMVHHLIDCVNSQLNQQHSCVSDTSQRQMLTQKQKFVDLFVSKIVPLVEDIYSTYKNIGSDFLGKYSSIFMDSCTKTCVLEKIQSPTVMDQINCLPKVDENMIVPLVEQCYRNVNYKEMIQKICTCSVGVGVKELQPYCQRLSTIQFPQWLQSQQQPAQQVQKIKSDQGLENIDQSGLFDQLFNLFYWPYSVIMTMQDEKANGSISEKNQNQSEETDEEIDQEHISDQGNQWQTEGDEFRQEQQEKFEATAPLKNKYQSKQDSDFR